jgi:hypothetical protein
VRLSVASDVAITKVVGEDQNDVWLFRLRVHGGARGQRERNAQDAP